MTVRLLDMAEWAEHKPLGPLGTPLVLVREDVEQNTPAGLVVAEGEQELHRALGNVPGSPGAAVVLLDAVRDREVDHGVVDEPREAAVDPCDSFGGSLQHDAGGHAVPVAVDGGGIRPFRREPALRGDRDPEGGDFIGADDQHGVTGRAPS